MLGMSFLAIPPPSRCILVKGVCTKMRSYANLDGNFIFYTNAFDLVRSFSGGQTLRVGVDKLACLAAHKRTYRLRSNLQTE